MADTVEHLLPVLPLLGGGLPDDLGDVSDHPMRRVVEQVAADGSSWTAEQAEQVAAAFDALAAGWEERTRDGRNAPLLDAIDRGPVRCGGTCLELGSGTGLVTPDLAARWARVLCVDIAGEMLRRAPVDLGHRILADGAHLPLPDGSVDTAVLVNTLLFPGELDRVLSAAGTVVWVNSRGPSTPIHLPAERVAAALPGRWAARASCAGAGTWAVLRRA